MLDFPPLPQIEGTFTKSPRNLSVRAKKPIFLHALWGNYLKSYSSDLISLASDLFIVSAGALGKHTGLDS